MLVGGLGLSATLWLLDTVHFNIFDSSTLLSAMAMGTGIWWWRQRDLTPAAPTPVQPLVTDRSAVETQLDRVQTLLNTLAKEAEEVGKSAIAVEAILRYQQQRQALMASLDRQQLSVAVVGETRTGKSTLIDLMQAAAVVDTNLAKLSLQEVTLSTDEAPAKEQFSPHDAVLLVTDGDITESSLNLVKDSMMAGQGVVLAFNKTDHYDPADQETILRQLEQRVASLPSPVQVVSVAAAPRPIKVRRHQDNGTVKETMEPAPVVVEPLYQTLNRALVAETAALVAATTLRQTQTLRQTIQRELNGLRRDCAQTQVDQLQWVAAATAFANPVPTIDLLATVAINGQLIMDLGKIYGFNLSLEEAKTAAGTLASLTVKLGLVELSTQVLTTVLKSHFATYVAGGLIQGLSAAYLTRMAGLSLMDYFEESALADAPPGDIAWETIATRLQSIIQQRGQARFLQGLAEQGIERLKPAPDAALATAE
jgi:hypothetical protein